MRGIAARHLGWQNDFQANSIKHRTVLSVVRLGKEVRRRPKYTLKTSIIYWAITNISNWFIPLADLNYEGIRQLFL